MAPRIFTAALTVALAILVTPASAGQSSPLEHLTSAQRKDAIRRATVWRPTDIASVDVRTGPAEKGAFPPFSTVTCDYVGRKSAGASRKFECTIAPNDEVKVKYGEQNEEVYAEVAATRLLWALGFGADRMYPVRVICHGCPADPQVDSKHPLDEVTFDPATIERRMPGKTMETRPDEGWAWSELGKVRDDAGGSQQAERDALKLLAVMMQHTDNKPRQQRLVCLDKGSERTSESVCAEPFLMVNDLGLTFGRANLWDRARLSGANLERWAAVPIWKDGQVCVGKLSGSARGSLADPPISEGGRQFLADLLVQLSDQQLHDLFEIARFDRQKGESIDRWVTVFKHKRDEIVSMRCPK